MNITFLIGNGFDINVGLKTSYTDFLKYYTKQKSNDSYINEFKNNISSNMHNWSHLEIKLGNYTEGFNARGINAFNRYKKDLEEKLLVYLKEQEESIDYNENKIEIFKNFANSITNFKDLLVRHDNSIITKIFENHINEEYYYNYITFNYTTVFDKCFELTKQKISTMTYHMCNVNSSKANYHNNIIHIHGTTEESMILGVDNIEQISNPVFADNVDFVDTFVKSNMNTELGNMNDIDFSNIIKTSSIICIYGMSLGETDKRWWQEIIEHLNNSNRDAHLIIFCHEPEVSNSRTSDKIDKKKEVINYFLSHAKLTSEENNKLKSKIHIAINKLEMFNIKLAKKENKEAVMV